MKYGRHFEEVAGSSALSMPGTVSLPLMLALCLSWLCLLRLLCVSSVRVCVCVPCVLAGRAWCSICLDVVQDYSHSGAESSEGQKMGQIVLEEHAINETKCSDYHQKFGKIHIWPPDMVLLFDPSGISAVRRSIPDLRECLRRNPPGISVKNMAAAT